METLLLDVVRHIDVTRYAPSMMVGHPDDPSQASPAAFVAALEDSDVAMLPLRRPGGVVGQTGWGEIQSYIRAFREATPHVVHIHTNKPTGGRKVALAARLAGVPVLCRTEHLPPSVHTGRATRYIVKPLDAITDCIVVDSEANRLEQIRLLGRHPRKVHRSYCGVSFERYRPPADRSEAKARLGLNPASLLVGTVGRLAEQKGHRYFVDAARLVVERHRGPVTFVIVGDGEERPALERQIAHHGLGERVLLAGFTRDYLRWQEAFDVGVMPSLWEGFSISMLEFMALGCPMVVSDHGSFVEAVEDGVSGLIVPRRDGAALGQAILRLLGDADLAARLGAAARERVATSFTLDRHVHDLMALYDDVLARKGPPRAVARSCCGSESG